MKFQIQKGLIGRRGWLFKNTCLAKIHLEVAKTIQIYQNKLKDLAKTSRLKQLFKSNIQSKDSNSIL